MSKNRVWLVTGTSSGLGSALVHELLRCGYCVVATSRKMEALREELSKAYDTETLKRVLVTKLDVTQPDEVKEAFAAGLRKFGRIDVVVNNAGYVVLGEIEACPIEHARAQFEVLFWGPVHVSKEAIRIFRDVNPVGEGGLLLNVSSVAGYSAQPTLPYYASATFALEGFTESLRKEMSPEWKVQATIVELGGFETEWRSGNMVVIPPNPEYSADSSPTKQHRSLLRTTPLIGAIERAAKAFLNLAEKKEDLPLRIQLGTDSLTVIRYTAMKTIADGEKWEAISHSTNKDGIDPNRIFII